MNENHKFEYLHLGLSDDILRRKWYGDFKGALELIDRKLKLENLSQAMRNNMIVQREIILRLPESYPYTKNEAIAKVQNHILDFTEEEFLEREMNGEIDWIYIEGIPHYFDRFYETLIKTDLEFAKRAGVKNFISDGSNKEDLLDYASRIMREKGSISNRIKIRASLRIKDEYFQPGELVRVHLPIPCNCSQQSEISIDSIEPYGGQISPEDAPQRTIFWEEEMIGEIETLHRGLTYFEFHSSKEVIEFEEL